MVHAKGRDHLLKEVEQLKHSSSTKGSTANKVTAKYKKQCQILRLLRKKENKSDKLQVPCISYPYFAHISIFLLYNWNRRENQVYNLLQLVTPAPYMLLAFKKESNKFYFVQASKIIKSKDIVEDQFSLTVTTCKHFFL